MQDFPLTPTPTFIITDANRHPFASLTRRIREEDAVLVVYSGICIADHAGLTDRFNEGFGVPEFCERIAAVAAPRVSAPFRRDVVAAVEIEVPLHCLNDNRFIGAGLRYAADAPRLTLIIAEDEMRETRLGVVSRISNDVIARND